MGLYLCKKCVDNYTFFCCLLIHSLPSTTLETNIDEAESPTTFSIVAGGSIIVAMIVKIGRALALYPIIVNIIISEMVPPPIGTAVINKLAIKATANILPIPPIPDTSVQIDTLRTLF